MGKYTAIGWTDSTFNPWIGCTKVSPACDNCYAEAFDKRTGGAHWGPRAERRRTSPANWRKPLIWDAAAKESGRNHFVFCASLADVFDNAVLDEWRTDLWALIKATPNLTWLILSKRPQNMRAMLPADWRDGYPNVWLGVTVENQEEADRRIWSLLQAPARLYFLSIEPLLGPVDLTACAMPITAQTFNAFTGLTENGAFIGSSPENGGIEWVIVGGESGAGFRPMNPLDARSIRDQVNAAGDVAFFFKQWGGRTPKAGGNDLDGVIWNLRPEW